MHEYGIKESNVINFFSPFFSPKFNFQMGKDIKPQSRTSRVNTPWSFTNTANKLLVLSGFNFFKTDNTEDTDVRKKEQRKNKFL
jgi:hypothetical protein